MSPTKKSSGCCLCWASIIVGYHEGSDHQQKMRESTFLFHEHVQFKDLLWLLLAYNVSRTHIGLVIKLYSTSSVTVSPLENPGI
jgi:hypothetical protein